MRFFSGLKRSTYAASNYIHENQKLLRFVSLFSLLLHRQYSNKVLKRCGGSQAEILHPFSNQSVPWHLFNCGLLIWLIGITRGVFVALWLTQWTKTPYEASSISNHTVTFTLVKRPWERHEPPYLSHRYGSNCTITVFLRGWFGH